MGFLGGFREFWRGQSRNYKVFLTRDALGRLLGGVGSGYASIYMRNLGASALDISMLDSIASLVRMLLSMPGGILADRVKRVKRLYIIGELVMLPVNLFKAFAGSFRTYQLARIWEVVTFRVTNPTVNIIWIASMSNRDRVKALVMSRTFLSAIGLVAPLLAAYLVTSFGGLENVAAFRPLFLIQFGVSVVMFALLALGLKEPEIERSMPQGNVLRSTLDIFREVPGLRFILFMNVVRTLFMSIRTPLNQLYFYEIKNADAYIIGLQGTINTAVVLLFSVPIGNITDRIGRRRLGYISQVVFAGCVLAPLLTPPTHPQYLLIYSFLSALGSTMEIGWQAFIQEYIPLEMRGRWMGVNTMATALVGIPAPLIGGYLWGINPDYLWWIAFVYYLFISIPLMRTIPEREAPRTF
ncbi:MAG TPA: MFS transporter [Patescibacteria group bacterium]|nr:MFS transporter [Patescibacteria group bacterium]